MFSIPDIDSQLQGIKDSNLDIFDDSKLLFYLKQEYSQKWKYITKISIRNSYCTQKFIINLAQSKYAQNIQELDLSRNFSTVNDEFLQIITDSRNLDNIECIDCSDTDVTNEGIVNLVSEPNKIHVNKLILYGCLYIDKTIMEAIEISNSLKPRPKDPNILNSKDWYGLKYLDLRATNIDDQAIKILVQSDRSMVLEYLDISLNEYNITNKSMEYIQGTKYLNSLKTLKVASCKIDNQGLGFLSRAECLVNLEELDISNDKDNQDKYNIINDEGFNLLSKSQTIEKLKYLNVRATNISSDGFQNYFNSDCCKYLEEIKCTYCIKVDDKFLKVLQESRDKNLQNINKVAISCTGVSAEYTKNFVENNPDLNVVFSFDFDYDLNQNENEQNN